jgi:hypothetical protein
MIFDTAVNRLATILFFGLLSLSFRGLCQSPGNVSSGLQLWFKASAGAEEANSDAAEDGDPILNWLDQSGSNNHAIQSTAGEQPVLDSTNTINGYPVLRFDGTDDYLPITNLNYADLTTLDEFSVYAIVRSSQTGEGIILSYDRSSFFRFALNHSGQSSFGLSTTQSGSTDDFESSSSAAADDGDVHIVGGGFDGVTTGDKQLFLDGTVADQQTVGTGYLGNASELPRYGFIGTGSEATVFDGSSAPTNYFNGDMAELIYYERILTSAERKRLESYLAIKYGLTLDPDDDGDGTAFQAPNADGIDEGDYLASDGSVLWDASSNSTYYNDIAFIGRDDNSGLSQIISSSIAPDARVSIDKGSAFGSDMAFLGWGHDGGTIEFTTANADENYAYSLERIYKVAVTGSPGVVSITFDLTGLRNTGYAADYALLIDENADFTNDAVAHTTGASLNGDLLTFTDVNFSDEDCFTIALELQGPADELENLQLWLRSDLDVYSDPGGTTTASPGDNIALWKDRSINGHAYIQDYGSSPTLESRGLFHALDFSDGSKYLRSDAIISGTTARTMFVVLRTNVLNAGTSNNAAFALAPNASAGRGYGLFVEAPDAGVGTGLGLRVYGNKLMNYETSVVTPTLISTQSGSSANVVDSEIYANGLLLTDVVTQTANALNTSNLGSLIGGFSSNADNDPETNFDFDGDVYEVIVFDDELSNLRREKINSYLAIKYGITKQSADDGSTATLDERDYLASDETIVWDWSLNAGYNAFISGIGRDDNAHFEKTTGESAEAGRIVSMDHGGSFSSDLEFILWGNDENSLTTTSSNTPASVAERISRTWKVQISGSPGTVDVSFDLSQGILNTGNPSDYALIVDTDTDFETGATVVTSGISIVGDILTFSGVGLADEDFFTLASPATKAPAGITDNLKLWLKADAGVTGTTGVSDWQDQSLNAFTAVQAVGSNQPAFVDDHINFNPALDFDGADHFLEISTGIFGADTYSGNQIFVVAETKTVQQSSFLYEVTAGSTNPSYNIHLPWDNDNVYYDGGGDCCTNNRLNVDWGASEHRPYLWTFMGSTAANADGHRQEILRNGKLIASDATYDAWTGSNSDFYIGKNDATDFYNGSIAEIIVYSDALPAIDQQKIQSYLAVKYGFTLDQSTATDYLASDGTTIFDADGALAGYTQNITLIGKDEASELHQHVSINQDSLAYVKIEKQGGFSSDLNFVGWGHDGNPLTTTGTGVPAPYAQRIERIWRTDITGTPGSLDVSFILKNGIVADPDPSGYALLVDSDTDFSDATVVTTGTSITGDTLTFPGVSFSDLDFFTLAVPAAPGPGGVFQNLVMWLRGDVGVGGGSAVGTWEDQSPFEYDLAQNTASARPDGGSNTVNFNEVLTFDGTDDYFPVHSNLYYDASSSLNDLAVFSVFLTNYTGGGNDNWAFLDFDRSEFFNFYVRGSGELGLSYTGASTSDIYGNTSLNDGAVHIGAGLFQNSLTNESILRYDGVEDLAVDDVANGFTIGTNSTRYGFVGDGSEAAVYDGSKNDVFYEGQMGELIYFENYALTSQEIQRIESYLAVKYGITLGGATPTDYLASNAAVVWDATANATYHHNVAGIGRDDASLLSQPRSKSTGAGAAVEVDKGGPLASDLDFILWGHDNATGSSNDVPAGYVLRLRRVWKTSIAGTPGNVDLTIDLNTLTGVPSDLAASKYTLLIDSDGFFSTTDVEHTTGASINAGVLSFTDVPLIDDGYFTIATVTDFKGPGGVFDGLALWLSADNGVENTSGDPATDGEDVAAWRDRTPFASDGDQTAASERPSLSLTSTINSNPFIRFTGTDNMPLRNLFYSSGNEIDELTVYAIARSSETSEQIILTFDRSEYFRFSLNHAGTANFGISTYDGSVDDFETSNVYDAEDGFPHMVGARFDGVVTGDKELFIDGTISDTRNVGTTPLGTGTTRYGFIGANSEASSFDGSNTPTMSATDVAEIIYFERALSATERQQVESYLAFKYGISLNTDTNGNGVAYEGSEGDWVASDGTTIWDADLNTAYNTDIIAIARDDQTNLLQKQSSTQDDSLRVFVDTYAANNQDNTGTIATDMSFLVVGHNGETQRGKTEEMPASMYSRLEREWMITNTNFTDTYSLEIEWDSVGNVDINDLRLLVDDDGDFSNAAVFGTADGLTFSFGSVIISGINTSHIPLNSTRYVTLGSANPNTPLPVEFSSFTAEVRSDKTVELRWQTVTETNNDFFTVVRSRNGQHWEELESIDGAGNSAVRLNYSYIDQFPYAGMSYYRIRQTDFDGTSAHSDIRQVTIETLLSTKVYPNSFREEIRVDLNGNAVSGWGVFNHLGQDVTTQVEMVALEGQQLLFRFSHLPGGLYLLKINGEAFRVIKE